jgi:hypothetical protein
MYPSDSNRNVSDPKYIGPGTWFTIHLKARHSDNVAKKADFVDFMWMIAKDFKCKDCSEHCRKYLEAHPIQQYYDVKSSSGEEIGCFKWSWMFHNAVNARLNKPIVDWTTAYGMYFTDVSVCEVGCGETPTTAAVPTTPKTSYRAKDPEPVSLIKSRFTPPPSRPVVYVTKGETRTSKPTFVARW